VSGDDDEGPTSTLTFQGASGTTSTSDRLRIEVLEGPDVGTIITTGPIALVGTLPPADLVLRDDTVSRRHTELRAVEGGVLAIDLGSKNGTKVGGVLVKEVLLTRGEPLEVGATKLSVTTVASDLSRGPGGPLGPRPARFGDYLTGHAPLAASLTRLERAALSDSTVLLQGETGTGKEVLARAVHDGSSRREGPYVIVDCGGVTASLLESQLFGHKKGAFTGAVVDHVGAFESANGGTVFLDELGELPLELQPKLLRALEARTIRRVGDVGDRAIDVRFIAATNRDLEAMSKDGRFRSDLYYRVAVVSVTIPPLRARPEDVPILAVHLVERLSRGRAELMPDALSVLSAYDWPGNTRELRNVIERALAVLDGHRIGPADLFPEHDVEESEVPGTFHEAKDQVIAAFEARYVRALLERNGGNVSRAARESGLSRNALYALMRRAGLDVA
jgi:two-component system response regulator GlrR